MTGKQHNSQPSTIQEDTTLLEGRQDSRKVQAMFDEIAPTYDRLNHILSGGMDFYWRKRAISMLESKRGGTILDIAAGSGDLSIDALSLNPSAIVATDFALGMLGRFAEKISAKRLPPVISLAGCDAMRLPFADGSFDVTMVAFGIRNFTDRLAALREMHRVLKPGGISLILELGVPSNPIMHAGYRLHTGFVLPLIGKLVSRHGAAYTYLPESISRFPDAQTFLALMRDAGFERTSAQPLTAGVVNVFTGVKPGR